MLCTGEMIDVQVQGRRKELDKSCKYVNESLHCLYCYESVLSQVLLWGLADYTYRVLCIAGVPFILETLNIGSSRSQSTSFKEEHMKVKNQCLL